MTTDSIFYWPWLVSWFLVLLAVTRARLPQLFPRTLWLTRPVRTDALMSALHVFLLNRPLDAIQVAVFGAVYPLVRTHFLARAGHHVGWHAPVAVEAGLAAAVTVLTHDLATWVVHWLSHRSALLWRFHSVHHSVTRLTMFALYRDHPVDHAVRSVFRGTFTGIGLGVLHRLLPGCTWGVELLGVGIGFLIYLPTVHLAHCHVPIRYPRLLAAVFRSPHLHQIHHSADERHARSNYGVIFSFWDRLFGTLHDERFEQGALEYGLGQGRNPYGDSLLRCLLAPFIFSGRASRARADAGSTTSP